MPDSLYTAAEIKRQRDLMVKQQGGIDPILNEPFKEVAVLDHDHTTQHCRAALNRNTNAFEGLVFNAYKRCLQWLTDVPLPEVLRNLAIYLENDYTDNPYHVGWLKRAKTDFNKLKSAQQDAVLIALGTTAGTNLASRKALFAKVILDRTLGYDTIKTVINLQRNS